MVGQGAIFQRVVSMVIYAREGRFVSFLSFHLAGAAVLSRVDGYWTNIVPLWGLLLRTGGFGPLLDRAPAVG